MQYPRIHINGSSAESLLREYQRARLALADALYALRNIDVNGRDYYVINSGAASIAMREHQERVAAIQRVLEDMTAIHENITKQHDERQASRAR